MRAAPQGLATTVASLIVLAAILWPSDELPAISVVGLDKAVHALLFGMWALALRHDWRPARARPVSLVAAAAAAGLLTETMQLFAPGRSFDLMDLAADAVGGALAAAGGGALERIAGRLASRLKSRRGAARDADGGAGGEPPGRRG